MSESPPQPRTDDDLLATLYADLRAMAERRLRKERPDHTLQPTALVHEVFLRVQGEVPDGQDALAFFRRAAAIMRRILIDHARRKNTRRRGGNHTRVPLDLGVLAIDPSLSSVSAIDQAIDELEQRSPRTAEVVRLRFFAGLTESQVAQVMQTSERTVRRDWTFARAWLLRRFEELIHE